MMQRRTRQRDTIRAVIERANRPLDVQDVLARARRHVPRLGIATVYRTINALLADGIIVPVEIPGRPVTYERANLRHHHHFYCTACKKVYEMEGCLLGTRPAAPCGFKVESHEITLFGTCAACA